jgi:hypothetical protein
MAGDQQRRAGRLSPWGRSDRPGARARIDLVRRVRGMHHVARAQVTPLHRLTVACLTDMGYWRPRRFRGGGPPRLRSRGVVAQHDLVQARRRAGHQLALFITSATRRSYRPPAKQAHQIRIPAAGLKIVGPQAVSASRRRSDSIPGVQLSLRTADQWCSAATSPPSTGVVDVTTLRGHRGMLACRRIEGADGGSRWSASAMIDFRPDSSGSRAARLVGLHRVDVAADREPRSSWRWWSRTIGRCERW